MEKVIINVDWDGNYGAVPANEDIAVVVTGKTLSEIKERMTFSLDLHLADMRADDDLIPAEFEGEYEFEYHFTTRALLQYTSTMIPRKKLAEVTGINQQQLTHYASGWRHPRADMQKRIVKGIHDIGKQLISVSL